MSKQNEHKKEFVRFNLRNIEHISRDKEAASEYLASEGINADKLVAEGLNKIRKMLLQANARKTQREMEATKHIKEQARSWVDELLSKQCFSLVDLVQQEGLSVSFSNLETMNQEDIRSILIRHFTLKFLNQPNKGSS
jgi:hypothetical protein